MSLRTQFGSKAVNWLGLLSWGTAFCMSSAAWAGRIDDAQNKLLDSYTDFYKQVRTMRSPSQKDVSQLADHVVMPASVGMTNAINQETVDALKDQGVTFQSGTQIKNEVQDVSEGEMMESLFAPIADAIFGSDEGKGAEMVDVSGGDAKAGRGPASESHGLKRPDFVLDGKNIPKVLDYPGK